MLAMIDTKLSSGERIAQIDRSIDGIMNKVARGIALQPDYDLLSKLQSERDNLLYDFQLQFQKRA
mgnify:CR=1 FL=1